ncbi:tripartite tricarboxylate transporter TctB family protein [Natrialbaceae archaeon A-arb3/5]
MRTWARTIEWDLLLYLLVFGFFWYQSYAYEGETGQMPRLFLIAGTAFAALKLAIEHMGGSIGERARSLDASIVSSMEGDTETPTPETSERIDQTTGLVLLGGLLLGFAAVAYFAGFLAAVPVFAIGVAALLGPDGYVRIALATVIMILFIYGIFGLVMNVPVTERAI